MAGGLTSYGLPTLPENAAERDARLLATWKKSSGAKKEKALGDLLTNMNGPIMTAVNAFQGAPMPKATMELEGKRHAIDAFKNFDASRGVSMANFVTTSVKQKLYRYVGIYQNVARIPEYKIQQIGPLREATADLTSRFGREPTTDELADHMGVTTGHITDLRRLLRKDLTEEGGGGVEQLEAFEHDPDYERAMMAYYSMNQAEKQVFDFSLGAHGQRQLANNDIAAKLKISAGRVSQIKKAIAEKIKPYITGAA